MRQKTVDQSNFLHPTVSNSTTLNSLTFSPGSPTNPWGPGNPCRRDGEYLYLVFVHLYYCVIFVYFCLVPVFQGCLAVQVLRHRLGVPDTDRKLCHDNSSVIRLCYLISLLYSHCFPLILEHHQFPGCPVKRERKTVIVRNTPYLFNMWLHPCSFIFLVWLKGNDKWCVFQSILKVTENLLRHVTRDYSGNN